MSRPTIRDVAEKAGVSKSLVSLVLRNAPHVSDAKRAAVLAAIDDLGYRPNAVARSLVRRHTSVLGVLVSDLHNPFFADLVSGIEAAARQRGYATFVNSGSRSPTREAAALETMLELRADGIIMAGSRLATPLIAAASRTVPVVLITRAPRLGTIDSIVNDDIVGARLVVEYLIGLGHEAIAHVDGGREPGGPGRRRGYERTMQAHGLERHTRVSRGAFTEEGGAIGTRALLEKGPPPTAIFAANDQAALGAFAALDDAGLNVPDDVSLVGYDNTSIAAFRHIALTTINQPRREMGEKSVELLLERLEGQRTQPRRLVLDPVLVERRTTAPPR